MTTKLTVRSLDEKLEELTLFLINKVAHLEVQLEDFKERAVRADDYLANRIDELTTPVEVLAVRVRG